MKQFKHRELYGSTNRVARWIWELKGFIRYPDIEKTLRTQRRTALRFIKLRDLCAFSPSIFPYEKALVVIQQNSWEWNNLNLCVYNLLKEK